MAALARHFLRHLPTRTPFSERWAFETMRPETVVCGSRLRARDFLESTEGQEQRLKTNIQWSTQRALTWGWVVEISPWSLLRGGVCREAGARVSVNQYVHDLDIASPQRSRQPPIGSGCRWLPPVPRRAVGHRHYDGFPSQLHRVASRAVCRHRWSSANGSTKKEAATLP